MEGPAVPVEERASEMNDCTLQTDHRPHSPPSLHHVEGEKSGNERMNFSLGKRVKGQQESAVLILP